MPDRRRRSSQTTGPVSEKSPWAIGPTTLDQSVWHIVFYTSETPPKQQQVERPAHRPQCTHTHSTIPGDCITGLAQATRQRQVELVDSGGAGALQIDGWVGVVECITTIIVVVLLLLLFPDHDGACSTTLPLSFTPTKHLHYNTKMHAQGRKEEGQYAEGGGDAGDTRSSSASMSSNENGLASTLRKPKPT